MKKIHMKTSNRTVAFLCLIILAFYPEAAFAQDCYALDRPTSTSFSDNGNGTVTDLKTGLMWKKQNEVAGGNWMDDKGRFTWAEALQRAEEVNRNGGFAGYPDWRVPNIKELLSIVEEQCTGPAINITVFQHSGYYTYWSSSPYANDGKYAWCVEFDTGEAVYTNKTPDDQSGLCFWYVRLVRGGQ